MADMIFTDVGIDPNPVKTTGVYNIKIGVEEDGREKIGFAVFDENDGSLIFYADTNTPEVGTTYKGQIVSKVYSNIEQTGTSAGSIPWYGEASMITSVDFDRSFATIRVKSSAYWFHSFTNCKNISLENFDTSAVTTMTYMFRNCSGLTTLDLSPLDTSAVTDMSRMFYGCSGLTTLDLSPLDISAVTDMTNIFYGCSGLTALDLSPLDTSAVTNMSYMFSGCSGLTTLDLTPLDTSAVNDMSYMFRNCYELMTIYSDDSKFKTDKVTSGNSMFLNCGKLVGGAGTAYSSGKISYTMAHVDTEENPGYFTAK